MKPNTSKGVLAPNQAAAGVSCDSPRDALTVKAVGVGMGRVLLTAAITSLSLLTGCASTNKEAQMHYAAQADHHAKQLAAHRPLFVLEAVEGQTIELKGVKKLEVNAPQSQGGQPFTPFVAPRNQWLDLAQTTISTAGAVAAPYLGAKGTANIVTAVGTIGTSGFSALKDLGTSSVTALAEMTRNVQPNITVTGTGNAINGNATNTTTTTSNATTNTNSGNTTTTTTSTTTIACSSGPGGAAGNAGTGTATQPAGAGGPGGTSGSVNCNPVPK